MASNRFLMRLKHTAVFSLAAFWALSGCSTSGITGIPDSETREAVLEIIQEGKADEILKDVNADGIPISTLADLFASQQNDIPEAFARIKTYTAKQVDLTKGYRIQIYSGESVVEADTVAAKFRGWVSANVEGYQADTYTFFKTPYYRVHVGDFHEREKALKYSRLIKREFKDAWVVYDTVNPYAVPDDSVGFTLAPNPLNEDE